MKVTKENFEEFLETLIIGEQEAQSYNTMCFSMMEVQRAIVIERLVDHFIYTIHKKGYSLHRNVDPILRKYDDSITSPNDEHLKKIDDDFYFDASDFKQAYEYSSSVKDRRENKKGSVRFVSN